MAYLYIEHKIAGFAKLMDMLSIHHDKYEAQMNETN